MVLAIIIFLVWLKISEALENREKRRKNKEKKSYGLSTEPNKYPVLVEAGGKLKKRKIRESYDYEEEPRKGRNENILSSKAKEVFGEEKVYAGGIRFFPFGEGGTRRSTSNVKEDKKRSYYPDIAYYDEKENFAIDIEIDEPYTHENGERKPIHYIREWKSSDRLSFSDSRRDKNFIENGWHVIRFSERQAKEEPLGCCNYIFKVMKYVGYKSESSDISNRVPTLCSVEEDDRWTRDEALKMKR